MKIKIRYTIYELKDDKDKIDAMIVSLEAERADYVTKIGAMGYDVKNYFGLENSVSNTNNRGRAVNIDVKMDELETDLKSQYDLLNDQKDELNNSRSKFKKAIVTKKINRTMDRISRLQDKQGKLSTTQNMIINASSDRYIEKKMAENRKRMEEFRRVNEYNIKINE